MSPGLDEGRAQALARARSYPHAAPRDSFVLVGEQLQALSLSPTGEAGDPHPLAGARACDPTTGRDRPLAELAGPDPRTPVLAYGANRSPEALARKRAAPRFPADAAIVLVRALAHDLDVVFSAHVSPAGSIAATLQRSPGTTVEAAVLYLTDDQLSALHATEPNYTFEDLTEVEVELEGDARLGRIGAYVSRHGCLTVAGAEVALAEVPATGRRLDELTQPEVLATVAARLGHHGELDDFILENIADPELAAARTRDLRADARPLAAAGPS